MILGRQLIEKMYSESQVEERIYSTGNDELDDLLEKAFCDGYEYAQREYAEKFKTLGTLEELQNKGEEGSEELKQALEEKSTNGEEIKNAVTEIVDKAKDKAEETGKKAGEKVSEIVNAVEETGKKVNDKGATKEKIEEAAKELGQKIKGTWEKTSKAGQVGMITAPIAAAGLTVGGVAIHKHNKNKKNNE